jgi:hypothetical protein
LNGVPDASGQKPDWRTRKLAYLAHLEAADADLLLGSASEKLYNARAIVMDLHTQSAGPFSTVLRPASSYCGELARFLRTAVPRCTA